MKEPLQEGHLQHEARDPRASIVLLHFKTQGTTLPEGIFGDSTRHWVFAVSNEWTGWNFRRLDHYNMIFRTDLMEADVKNADAGWVTFVASPGLNYVTVTNRAAAQNGALDLVATPFPDRISVVHSADRAKNSDSELGWEMMDFIDTPRFAVQVPGARSLVYAGTIVRTHRCGNEDRLTSRCPYDLTVIDEGELAETFVSRYQKNFPTDLLFQTQLFTIPQSRTIEIKGGPTGRD